MAKKYQTARPAQLTVDIQGIQRCSVCCLPFSRDAKPPLEGAF
jgi:hypothetical protein